MDLLPLSQAFIFAKRKKKSIFLLSLFGISTYGAYKLYNSPSLIRKRIRVLRLFRVFFSVIELFSDSTETFGLISSDLNRFLLSDSDEIPNSFKQISKIARSDEFSRSVIRVSEALSVGILSAYRRVSKESSELGDHSGNTGFADRVIDKMLSNSGSGFASVVAGSFARNLVIGFYSSRVSGEDGENGSVSKWVDLIFEDKSKELIGDCIRVFVSKAVEVYLEKTMHINTYDEFFAGLTNPNHEKNVQELIVSVCNGAVETVVKTSHQVLTSNPGNSDPSSSSSPTDLGECSNSNEVEFSGGEKKPINEAQTGGWSDMMMSTLSLPRNQRFVFHVTGRVTFETFKSLVEFLAWKLSDGLRSSSNIVNDHVVENGRRVVRFFGLKSFLFACICLALYLHIIRGTRSLLAA